MRGRTVAPKDCIICEKPLETPRSCNKIAHSGACATTRKRLFDHQRIPTIDREYSAWIDKGCELSPSCFTCPLTTGCRFDEPEWEWRWEYTRLTGKEPPYIEQHSRGGTR